MTIRLDRFGRIVLPLKVRKMLGLQPGSDARLRRAETEQHEGGRAEAAEVAEAPRHPADPGDRRGDAARARHPHSRSGLRDRRLPAHGARVDSPQPPARPRREEAPALRGAARLGDRRQHRPALRDEPPPARDRGRGALQSGARGRRAEGRSGRAVRDGAHEPAVRAQVVDDVRLGGGRGRARSVASRAARRRRAPR